jgi:hypothetical protein
MFVMLAELKRSEDIRKNVAAKLSGAGISDTLVNIISILEFIKLQQLSKF